MRCVPESSSIIRNMKQSIQNLNIQINYMLLLALKLECHPSEKVAYVNISFWG